MNKILTYIKSWFGFNTIDYKTMYEEERKKSERFEFKFNKLRRHLKAIIKEADA